MMKAVHPLWHQHSLMAQKIQTLALQQLTVLTSKRNSLFDSKGRFHWTMNGVGLEFNH